MFRLNRYRSLPGNPNRIAIRNIGDAVATRFPAVGYFNQVQRATVSDIKQLADFHAFYADVAAPFKIQVAPDTDRESAFAGLLAAGFLPRTTTVRLIQECPQPNDKPWPSGLTIEPVARNEVEAYFATYLECFGAPRTGWTAAIANMRLLVGDSGMYCLFARMHGQPAGIGMLYVVAGVANFCAGGVLGPWRSSGLHSALIDARLSLAAQAGCDLAIGWSAENGPGHRNLLRAGFTLAYRDPVWSPAPQV